MVQITDQFRPLSGAKKLLRMNYLQRPQPCGHASGTAEPASGIRAGRKEENMGNLLWLIIAILVILWIGGFAMHVGGNIIHVLLVIAVIVLIFQLITGRRAL
jgi:hypothetical protein